MAHGPRKKRSDFCGNHVTLELGLGEGYIVVSLGRVNEVDIIPRDPSTHVDSAPEPYVSPGVNKDKLKSI